MTFLTLLPFCHVHPVHNLSCISFDFNFSNLSSYFIAVMKISNKVNFELFSKTFLLQFYDSFLNALSSVRCVDFMKT